MASPAPAEPPLAPRDNQNSSKLQKRFSKDSRVPALLSCVEVPLGKGQRKQPQNNMHISKYPPTDPLRHTVNSLKDLPQSQSCLGAWNKNITLLPSARAAPRGTGTRGSPVLSPALPVEPKSLPLLLSGPYSCTRMNPAQSPTHSSLGKASQHNRKPRHHCLLKFLFLYIFFVLKRKKHNYHKLQRTKALLE